MAYIRGAHAQQLHLAGRPLLPAPRSKWAALPVVLYIDEGRSATRRGAAKTTLLHNTTSSIMALSSSFTGF